MGLGGKDEVGVGTMGSYITAIDYKTGKTVWKHKFRTAGVGGGAPGLLTTAGRLLFGGDVSGNFVGVRSGKRYTALAHAGRPGDERAGNLHGRRPAARADRVGRHACTRSRCISEASV